MRLVSLISGVAILAIAAPILASETIAYEYDAKGRLVRVVRSGTVNNGVVAQYDYDRADNRSNVSTSGSPYGSPTPTPTPAPTNRPPIAVADNAGSMGKCLIKIVNVTANDSDPDGDALIVISASASGDMAASVASASSVEIDSGPTAGAKTISYTISDGHGGTANGTISVTVSGGVCN